MVEVTCRRCSLTRKFLVFWVEDHLWEVVTHGAVTVIIYCREHQHALHWHYRLMTYVNYDIFHRSNYFLCHFLTPMNFSELLSVTGKGISRIAATAS